MRYIYTKYFIVSVLCLLMSNTYGSKHELFDSLNYFPKINIDSCQKWALSNYPIIDQLQLIELSKNYHVKAVNTGYIPTVDIMALGAYIDGIPNLSGDPNAKSEPWKFIGAATLRQTIWDGGQLETQKKIIRAQAEIDKQNIKIALFDLKNKVSDIYFGILLAKEQEKQLELEEKYLKKSLNTVKVAMDNGTAYPSDLDELKVALLTLEQNESQLNYMLEAYLDMLSLFINKDLSINTEFEKPELILQIDKSGINRPEISLFKNKRALLNAHNPGAGDVLPTVSLIGMGAMILPEINMGMDPINHLFIGGLNIKWTLGGRAYTFGFDKKRLNTEKQKIDNEEETFLFNLDLNLSKDISAIKQWDEMIVKDNDIIELRKKITASGEIKYKNGVINLTELIRYINEESLARQKKTLHEVEKLKSIYQYNSELGY